MDDIGKGSEWRRSPKRLPWLYNLGRLTHGKEGELVAIIADHELHDNPHLTAALAYAQRSWYVFACHTPIFDSCTCGRAKGTCPATGSLGHDPIRVGCSCGHPACKNIGKHPRYDRTDLQHGLLSATVDEGQIRRWWARWPRANIAIRTGAVSKLVVLDVDPRHFGLESLAELEAGYGKIPETVQAITGGSGPHLYFAHPGEGIIIKSQAGQLAPGLDVKGDGGYVIAPPSLHQSGRRYVWEASSDPHETPIAALPDWLFALLHIPGPQQTATAAPIPDRVPQGQRHITLVSLAGSMRRRAMSAAAILAALRAENHSRCDPPLADDEVAKIATSVSRYPPSSVAGLHAPDPRPYRCLRYCQPTNDPWLGPQERRHGLPMTVNRLGKEVTHG